MSEEKNKKELEYYDEEEDLALWWKYIEEHRIWERGLKNGEKIKQT
jgi:hypothetical protein